VATQEFSKLLSSVQIRVSAYKYFKKIMLSIRCKDCNKELIGHPTKTVSCGCPNMATICGDKISAVDLSRVIMLNSPHKEQKSNVLSTQDIMWQEERRTKKSSSFRFRSSLMILGRVVEWFMALVLKTSDVQASGGSNPLPSVLL
jgi:ribosomal protein S27E